MRRGDLSWREIEWRSPLDAFAPLAESPFAALLHSGGGDARWSVLAGSPAATLEAREGRTFIDGSRVAASPFDALRALAASRVLSPNAAPDAPFLTGLIGFVGYEMGGLLESSAKGPASPFALPDMAFAAYDAAALFDNREKRAFIAARDGAAAARLEETLGREAPQRAAPIFTGFTSNFTADDYRAMVANVVELIRDGVLFQANVAQHFQAMSEGPARAFDLFRVIAAEAAPFAAFLPYKEGAVLLNSPERFFRIEGAGRIVAEPIKGTRPRGGDHARDMALAAELLADPKERAENIMIADLTRNDLSRICRDGSIREEAICALESHAHVHHLVSRISGVLREGIGAVEALETLFPCGSITGAPKIEAMKTIAAAEGVGRGPYCGAVGYIDDRGLADFAVAIRTMIVEEKAGRLCATFPAGGGVTLRSDPQAEYLETLVKAKGALRALSIDEARAS
ncbi:MAG: anthranilate synthase component I family protein [Parvularculaceae bacterium]